MAAAARATARVGLALLLAVVGVGAQDYDFFFLVLQWPGSYCDTKQSCCYPRSGKPAADFGIHGLWPNRDDGSYPQNCDPDSEFDPSKVHPLLPLGSFVSWCLC
jgi:ribonuclease T2